MNRFRSGATLSPIMQIEAYWSALRTGPGVPKRSQVDPRGLENVLEYAFILERIAPGIARFRIAGQHLNMLGGMETRGMPITSLFAPAARTELSAVLEHVFDTPAVADLTLEAETGLGRPELEGRIILLPLQSDLGDISRALGVLVTDGQTGRAPRRFDLTGTALRPVSDMAITPQIEATRARGFAEKQTPLTRRVPYLRLVK